MTRARLRGSWTNHGMRHPSRTSRFAAAATTGAFALGVAFLAACGHKATAADCQIIVDRNVEVEMMKLHITDPTAIAKKKEEEKNDPKTKADLDGCIGKRITDGMMNCVKNAQTGDEIDQCIR
jgi:hypothetical protein